MYNDWEAEWELILACTKLAHRFWGYKWDEISIYNPSNPAVLAVVEIVKGILDFSIRPIFKFHLLKEGNLTCHRVRGHIHTKIAMCRSLELLRNDFVDGFSKARRISPGQAWSGIL